MTREDQPTDRPTPSSCATCATWRMHRGESFAVPAEHRRGLGEIDRLKSRRRDTTAERRLSGRSQPRDRRRIGDAAGCATPRSAATAHRQGGVIALRIWLR